MRVGLKCVRIGGAGGTCVLRLYLLHRYDGSQPLNDLWEFDLREVLHDSQPDALTNFPVDAGFGRCLRRIRGGVTSRTTVCQHCCVSRDAS